jgi:ribonuclease BN (tRNA processing enzyme)
MRFVPLGVGDAFTALHFSFCLAVEHEGAWLLVDCPHPIRRMMRDASLASGLALDAGDVSAVVLTHLHADHVSGLEGLAYFSYFVTKRKLELLIHPAVQRRLWEGHLAAGMECLLPHVGADHVEKRFEDYFAVTSLDETRAVTHGPFTIECRRTIHHIPTTALRITAGGRTLGVSADTAFDETLIEWLSKADLVVHETNLGVHTPYEKLAALPVELRAKMRLVHYTDFFDLEASVIEPLREGRVYSV